MAQPSGAHCLHPHLGPVPLLGHSGVDHSAGDLDLPGLPFRHLPGVSLCPGRSGVLRPGGPDVCVDRVPHPDSPGALRQGALAIQTLLVHRDRREPPGVQPQRGGAAGQGLFVPRLQGDAGPMLRASIHVQVLRPLGSSGRVFYAQEREPKPRKLGALAATGVLCESLASPSGF